MGQVTIPTGTAQLQVHFTPLSALGSEPITSLGVTLDPGFTLPPFKAAIEAAVINLLTPCSAQWGASFVRLRMGDTAGPPYLFDDTSVVGASGGIGGSSSPPNVSFLLAFGSATAGRAGRGRMYIPGVPEGDVDNTGLIDPAVVGNIEGSFDAFMSDLAAVDITGACILHGEGTPLADTFSVVTSRVCRSYAATQRRRLRS